MSKRTPIEIRIGDRWLFNNGNGSIPRIVTYVRGDDVEYINASGTKRACALTTFKRWARGASLEFATDWSGRE